MRFWDFFVQELAIDLGTANTIILKEEKIVVEEPSIVAINRHSGKLIALGHQALQMEGRTHDDIKTIRPLKGGVIAELEASEKMLRGFIQKINHKHRLFSPFLKMLICVPSGITDVERKALREAALKAGGREVRLISEPMAAAIGMGIDVRQPQGHMVVDIGGGTSDIAVISLGGIVIARSIKVAGDDFTRDIISYIRNEYSLLIGERTAEKIKVAVGSVLPRLENPPDDLEVLGRDLRSGVPKPIMINYSEVARAINESIQKLEAAIHQVLEHTPPELAADIYQNGIYITGGGSLLRGLPERISKRISLDVHIAQDPLRTVARGTAVTLKNIKELYHITS